MAQGRRGDEDLVDPVLPELRYLSLTENPLDNRAHDLFLPAIQADGVLVAFDPNAAPVIQQVPPQAGTSGALVFDGARDFVEIPHDTALDLKRQLTLETWFRVDSFVNDWMPLIQKGSGITYAQRSYSIWVNENGYLYFSTADGTYESSVSTQPGSIQLGKWYHAAFVMNRDTQQMEAYLNGELAGWSVVTASNTATHDKPLLFGKTLESHPAYSPFAGAIDEVRLWNTIRTGAQIRGNMTATLTGSEPGLVGLWRLNESSGTVAKDATANGNDGTLGGVMPPGLGGTAVTFDGVDDYIRTPNIETFFTTNDSTTIELWFNPSGPGQILTELGQPAINTGWQDSQLEILPSGQVLARVWSSATVSTGVSLGTAAFTKWHHAVLRYNQATGVLDGFLDGVKSSPLTIGARLSPFEFGSDLHYALGALSNTNLAGAARYFPGRVADMRIWNVARTDAAILADKDRRLAGNEAGLVLYYRLDNFFGGATVTDSSPNGFTGTAFNGLTAPSQYAPPRFRPPIHLGVSDPDFDRTTLSAASDNPNVLVSLTGTDLFITPVGPNPGRTRITVTATDGTGAPHDRRGRTGAMTFDDPFGANSIFGTFFLDLDGDSVRDPGENPRENVNGDGLLQPSLNATPTTPWFASESWSGGSFFADPDSGYLALDSKGTLYASDAQSDIILRFDTVSRQFVPFTPVGNQEARGPRAIAFGADGALYVASNFDRNVRRYNGDTGAFIAETWPSDNGTLFSDLGMMAAGLGGQILYIVDFNPAASQVKIVRYDTVQHQLVSGAFVVDRQAGVFNEPTDVTIGPDGHIYLLDGTLRSVVRLNGTTGAALPAPGRSGALFLPPGTAGLSAGSRLAAAAPGRLAVVNPNGTIIQFDTANAALAGTAVLGPLSAAPHDVILDPQRRLYLSAFDAGGAFEVLVASQGEPTALTDLNGDYAFHDVPFVPAVPFQPAVLTALQATTANGGLTTTTTNAQYPNQIVTENNAQIDLFVQTRDGQQGVFSLAIPGAATRTFTSRQQLVSLINSQLRGAPVQAILNPTTGVITWEVISRGGLFLTEFIQVVAARTIQTKTETIFVPNGAPQQRTLSSVILANEAFGFVPGQTAEGLEAFLAGVNPLPANGQVAPMPETPIRTGRSATRRSPVPPTRRS